VGAETVGTVEGSILGPVTARDIWTHRGLGLRHERKRTQQEPGRSQHLRFDGPGKDSRVIKVQASSAVAGVGGDTNRSVAKAVAKAEDNRRPSDGCWEVQLPHSTSEAGERKDPVEGRG